MREDIILATDVFVDEMILFLVVEDDVDFLGAGSADVRAEHEPVRWLAVHLLGFQRAVEDFHVAAAAVDVLLVFDGELDNEVFALGGERLKLSAEGVEARILWRLQTFVGFLIVEELAGGEDEFSELFSGRFAVYPILLPRI